MGTFIIIMAQKYSKYSNCGDYSFEKKSIPKGSGTQSKYASAKVLAKAGTGSRGSTTTQYKVEIPKKGY